MILTIPTSEQIFGDRSLEIFRNYGTGAGAYDSAVTTGVLMAQSMKTPDNFLQCAFWSSSRCGDGDGVLARYGGCQYWRKPALRCGGVRPALPKSFIDSIPPHAVRRVGAVGSVSLFEWSAFAHEITHPTRVQTLESLWARKRLPVFDGQPYVFDAVDHSDESTPFMPEECVQYVDGGERYIRTLARPADSDSVFSNNYRPSKGDVCWLKVSPLYWLEKNKSEGWVLHKALVSGVQLHETPLVQTQKAFLGRSQTTTIDFKDTRMAWYLDTHIWPHLLEDGGMTGKKTPKPVREESKPKKSAYGVQIDDKPMPVKAQIDFYVKNLMSFMLHGKSGIGKTGRVEAIDPDLTAVPLWNGVLPEDIVGKVIYPNGATGLPVQLLQELARAAQKEKDSAFDAGNLAELCARQQEQSGGVWVPPAWYHELVRKCEAEPNKPHVLFIDEVTNAKPTTQSLIFHLVLKKSISPSHGKLPANAVVVMAGNDKTESGAAYNMPAPLFRRVPHIWLEEDVPAWLEWGMESHKRFPHALKIHPLVAAFVASRKEEFYADYDEENPKKWAVDPRGWVDVSDMIYANGGCLRRELLANKVGDALAANLLAFAQETPITLEDVLEGTFDKKALPETEERKLAATMNLRGADERQVEKVRAFIGEYFGKEILATFDAAWTADNDERALQIADLQKRPVVKFSATGQEAQP